jgi:ribonuclease P protein component
MVYLPMDSAHAFPAQSLFVVPKRSFRKAHDRNRIRRRIKEAYRLQKQNLYESAENEKPLMLAFIYTSKKEEPYEVISESVRKQLEKLTRKKQKA